MSNLRTVRERVERAASFFDALEGAVLTTFNLNGPFFEDWVLPTVLSAEGATTASRAAEVHARLSVTPCTVFYDPSETKPKISGRFRYVARPMPVRGRFFHPKIVILAGRSKAGRSENGTTWVYLGVSSANLTPSGWGRNAEAFAETWIHTRKQQSWGALLGFLAWLQKHASLREQPSKADAVERVKDVLQRMPDRKRFVDAGDAPWSGTLHARFYASVVHKGGLAGFMTGDRTRRPAELCVYSPYWGDVADQVAAFGAKRTLLVPALRQNRPDYGLSREDAGALDETVEVLRNRDEDGGRFWHMKVYELTLGTTSLVALGSCNFTRAGLAGARGNVEAMLVFDDDGRWLPEAETLELERLADEAVPEEERPQPAPVAVVVAWDWRDHRWRWWLEPGPKQTRFSLQVPGLPAFAIGEGTGKRKARTAPPSGSSFSLSFREAGVDYVWTGQISELNLDYSMRTYGRPLQFQEILDSWRGRPPRGQPESDLEDPEAEGPGAGDEKGRPAAFEAVNLYDLYRSVRALRARLEALEQRPEVQRSYLVARSDSVLALANLAVTTVRVPAVRYLVLCELTRLLIDWKEVVRDPRLVKDARAKTTEARGAALARLRQEERAGAAKAEAMLGWFEKQLAAADRKTAA